MLLVSGDVQVVLEIEASLAQNIWRRIAWRWVKDHAGNMWQVVSVVAETTAPDSHYAALPVSRAIASRTVTTATLRDAAGNETEVRHATE